MKILIAGSGLAGVFAALGALESGAEVVMIDPGLTLDEATAAKRDALAQKHWSHWTPGEFGWIRSPQASLSAKKVFNSDIATRVAPFTQRGCNLLRSYARGGLSLLWGRGIEPPYVEEAAHWPNHAEFETSLIAVLKHLPFAAEEDNLATVMPLYAQGTTPHPLTEHSTQLLTRWNKNGRTLNAAGIHFGKTRLALQNSSCTRCGLCFYGCVYGAMFDSTQLLTRLTAQYANFEYHAGATLQHFHETREGIEAITAEGNTFHADRLILACGAVETTRIALRSLNHTEAQLQSSDMIVLPFFSFTRAGKQAEGFHALSQLTLTVKKQLVSKRAIVMHLFGENPLLEDTVLRRAPKFLHGLLHALLKRCYIAMVFLHSADSTPIRITPHAATAAFPWNAWRIYARLLFHLFYRVPQLGMIPLPIGGVKKPGSSVHVGASLQPTLSSRVFVADAAALPEIPAGSYSLSIMAHAHRTGINAASY